MLCYKLFQWIKQGILDYWTVYININFPKFKIEFWEEKKKEDVAKSIYI